MSDFLQLLVSGLALGTIYALVALGFVVIYRSSQVFNFAHGEFLTFGAFMAITLLDLGLPWGVAVLGAMAATGILGAIIEKSVLRPLVGRPVFVPIILTIFVGSVLRTLMLLKWGSEPRGLPTPWDTLSSISVGGASLLVNSIAAVGASGVALISYFLLIRYTRMGVAMRATSSDQETALGLGIPVGRVLGSTWFIAGAFAALAGIFLGLFPRNVDINLGFVAMRAFPAVIIGGLESPGGAIIGGIFLGILEVLTQGYINPLLGEFGKDFHAVFPYLVMIVFLVVRPYGLFGMSRVQRV